MTTRLAHVMTRPRRASRLANPLASSFRIATVFPRTRVAQRSPQRCNRKFARLSRSGRDPCDDEESSSRLRHERTSTTAVPGASPGSCSAREFVGTGGRSPRGARVAITRHPTVTRSSPEDPEATRSRQVVHATMSRWRKALHRPPPGGIQIPTIPTHSDGSTEPPGPSMRSGRIKPIPIRSSKTNGDDPSAMRAASKSGQGGSLVGTLRSREVQSLLSTSVEVFSDSLPLVLPAEPTGTRRRILDFGFGTSPVLFPRRCCCWPGSVRLNAGISKSALWRSRPCVCSWASPRSRSTGIGTR